MCRESHRTLAGPLSLALIIASASGPVVMAQPETAGEAPAVRVTSEPSGALVLLDGKRVGRTPLSLAAVPAGDHQVTLQKEGFLESRRLISVVTGSASVVQVALTAAAGEAGEETSASAEEGSSKKKWLLIGAGAVAAGTGVALVARSSNAAPSVAAVTVAPSGVTALASATELTFATQASDPDGDALSYSWDLGDGSTETGQQATHVYAEPGSYTVRVTASDGKDTATGETTVTVTSLAGEWRGSLIGFSFTLSLRQNGSALSGRWTLPEFGEVTGFSGQVRSPRNLEVRASGSCERLEGALSTDGDEIRGLIGCGASPRLVFQVRRQ